MSKPISPSPKADDERVAANELIDTTLQPIERGIAQALEDVVAGRFDRITPANTQRRIASFRQRVQHGLG